MQKELKFKIGKQQLAQMAEIAVKSGLDTSKLTWEQTQQVLTLYSLEELFKRYQLDVPYQLNAEELLNVTVED